MNHLNPVIANSLQYAMFGATLGAVAGAMKGLKVKADNTQTKEREEKSPHLLHALPFLKNNADVSNVMFELAQYRSFSSEAYDDMCKAANDMCELQHKSATVPASLKMASLRTLGQCTSRMVEAVRSLRAHFIDSRPLASDVENFDEQASGVQKMCNDCTHNLTLTVQANM